MQVIRSQDGLSIINPLALVEIYMQKRSDTDAALIAISDSKDPATTIFKGTQEECQMVQSHLFLTLKVGESFDLMDYDPNAELGE